MLSISDNKSRREGSGSAYLSLIFVVAVWGCASICYVHLYQYFSPSVCSAMVAFSSAIALFFISLKHLHRINRRYFLIAVPTGLFNAVANLLQKIGLQYTTPARYAFLENLSCIVVPILMFILIRKKPTVPKLIASVLCLVGAFVLSGMSGDTAGVGFGYGEILCALAGIFYGVNIAVTGAFTKELLAPIYVMIQMWVSATVCFGTAITFNFIGSGDSVLEPFRFSWEPLPLIALIAFALITNALCWLLRTNAMKKIDASVVAVIMPFSAVVTAVLSVILGLDELTPNLVIGGILCLGSAVLSGVADARESHSS